MGSQRVGHDWATFTFTSCQPVGSERRQRGHSVKRCYPWWSHRGGEPLRLDLEELRAESPQVFGERAFWAERTSSWSPCSWEVEEAIRAGRKAWEEVVGDEGKGEVEREEGGGSVWHVEAITVTLAFTQRELGCHWRVRAESPTPPNNPIRWQYHYSRCQLGELWLREAQCLWLVTGRVET